MKSTGLKSKQCWYCWYRGCWKIKPSVGDARQELGQSEGSARFTPIKRSSHPSKALQCFSPLRNPTHFSSTCFSHCPHFSTSQRRKRGLSIRGDHHPPTWSWEPLFVREPSQYIPNRPRPLWIGPFCNLEKIGPANKSIVEGGVSALYAVSQFGVRSFLGFHLTLFHHRRAGRFCGCTSCAEVSYVRTISRNYKGITGDIKHIMFQKVPTQNMTSKKF